MTMTEDINSEAVQLIKDYKHKHHATTHAAALKCCIRYDRMLDIEFGRTIPKHSELIKLRRLNEGRYDDEGD